MATGRGSAASRGNNVPLVKLVVFDDPYRLPQSSQERVRYQRSDATETEDGLSDRQSARQVVPGKVSIASYDYKASSTAKSFQGTGTARGPIAGQWFRLDDHPVCFIF